VSQFEPQSSPAAPSRAPASAGRGSAPPGAAPLLEIENLGVGFPLHRGMIHAVNGLTLNVGRGETLALVGESGCGKSITALAVMRLVPEPGRVLTGAIRLNGENLLALSSDAMRQVRGDKISMIFQEPMSALNPVLTIGYQLLEILRLHLNLRGRPALERAEALLEEVGLPHPRRHLEEYPHLLSGGMRQRVMIAMARATEPQLMICDEPTTALDVTVQAQILELLRRLQERTGMSMLFITHDLGVVAEVAHRVVVMYGGEKVEESPSRALFNGPVHPYTRGLMDALPRTDRPVDPSYRLFTIPGVVPHPLALPSGCRFADRCFCAAGNCRATHPELTEGAEGRSWRCHFPLNRQEG